MTNKTEAEAWIETELIGRFLRSIGARKRHQKFILDKWSTDYYLIFDTSHCEEPETWGTADVLIAPCGHDPRDSDGQILLRSNCNCKQISTLLEALGSVRITEQQWSVIRK